MARRHSSHVPTEKTRRTVGLLSGYGIPQEQIAAEIGVSIATLERHYRADLDEGIRKANSLVVQNLHRQATKDSPNAVTAAIWWTKSRMKWRGESVEVTGKDGGPVRIEAEEKATEALTTLFGQIAAAKAQLH